jgi:hypothetical protein
LDAEGLAKMIRQAQISNLVTGFVPHLVAGGVVILHGTTHSLEIDHVYVCGHVWPPDQFHKSEVMLVIQYDGKNYICRHSLLPAGRLANQVLGCVSMRVQTSCGRYGVFV